MNKKINKKQIITLSVIVISSIILIILYWNLYSNLKETKELMQEKLYSYKKILCREKIILKKKKMVDKLYKKSEDVVLISNSESEAALQIQEIVSSISDQTELSIDRVDVPKISKNKDGINFVSMRISFSGDSESLLLFLYKLENHTKPNLIVDKIQIRMLPRWKNRKKFYIVRGFLIVKAILYIGEILK